MRNIKNSALILLPPFSLNITDPMIFLAGPIQGARDWQARATQLIHRFAPQLCIANPRRDYLDKEFIYEKQVDWETKHLRKAAKNGVILFWLAKETQQIPGRAYAQTTRFELAEWKTRAQRNSNIRLVVGIQKGFSGARYIRHRFAQDCPNIPIASSLIEACRIATSKL